MEFRVVRTYDNYIEANLQLNLLKDHHINCYLRDEYTVTIDPLLSPAIGGMKLMVSEADWGRAIELLEITENEYLRTVQCPKCGATTIEKIITVKEDRRKWVQVFRRFLGNPPAELSIAYRCATCNSTFTGNPPEFS
ncbi:putative signal transducing protein [Flavihumibacter petaseus]|uniref:DUF2007 domain-containing protein n=1 Tax=Flavihumibacter petaseus NBRC 106054 TaxID=1220578 RepID=A0A0E9MXM4_9BACT|nr:DUF2007 domain-containing protein [Flavihumibacter petaseus]GAO42263.1 hypothetical protein FPE01S_01_12760 [Flavihumibacter petaseus NBRC 106054]